MLRSIAIRFLIPALLAVTFFAFLGVPFADRLLADWFKQDVSSRAHLLANSMTGEIARFVARDDHEGLGDYLGRITADERLLAVMLCASNGVLIYKTERTPDSLSCRALRAPGRSDSQVIQHPDGSLQVSTLEINVPEAVPIDALLIQDLSYIDRRQSTMRSYVLASTVILGSVLALLVGSVFWLLLRRWIKLLIGDIRGLRFLDDAESDAITLPILAEVRNTLRELETTQRLEIDFQENWTPQALQQVVHEHLHSPEMFVISNREPYIHNQGPGGPVVQVPASGMVTALEPIMRACSGTWIAHGSGSADREVVDRQDRVRVPPDDPKYTLRRVWLTKEEEQGFYYGLSNEGIWPLCHLAYVRPAFREQDWRQYSAVNRKFAEVLGRESRTRDPVILIQDYHLALLPRLLRQRKPHSTIALFWHIPWPNAESFGVCPWKREMLTHMLAADILGFHTRYHCQNFLATVDRFIECQIDHEHMTITLQGHICRVVPYPISIEWPPRWLAELPAAEQCRAEVRDRYSIGADVALALGVERWDFTKGIVERFLAIEALLDAHPDCRGKISLLQVAAPSRSSLPAYKSLQEHTVAEARRINAKFATHTWQPIVLIDRHQEPRAVFELLRAADLCIVNSLHDGMNLVAKEFVAARDDEDGVLVLSSFTGASRELPEALLVNPFDVVETAAAILQAMRMPRDERRQRMKLMRRAIKENNVYRWAGRMLMDAAQIRQRRSLTSGTSTRSREREAANY